MVTVCDLLTISTQKLQTIFSQFDISPNPTTGLVNVTLSTDREGDYSLRVHNILGKTFSVSNLSLFKGENIIEVDFSDFKNGLYYVTLSSGDQVYTKKIIKQ